MKRFFMIGLLVLDVIYGFAFQNELYTVTQQYELYLTPVFQIKNIPFGNAFSITYPMHTTFLTNDGLEQIQDSTNITGIPLGFDMTYGGKIVDEIAINLKGYVVFKEKGASVFNVHSDTIKESVSDTIFGMKNSLLVSSLILGKDYDIQTSGNIVLRREGFIGGRRLSIEISSSNLVNGKRIYINNAIFLYETGTIETTSEFITSSGVIDTYGMFTQRHSTSEATYTNNLSSWDQPTSKLSNTSQFSPITNADLPTTKIVNNVPLQYIMRYISINFTAHPIQLFTWAPSITNKIDSAYTANDYTSFEQGDTVATAQNLYWYSQVVDSFHYDVLLGVDTLVMQLIQADLTSDSLQVVENASRVFQLVTLSLDSLGNDQIYYLKINKKDQHGNFLRDTIYCFQTDSVAATGNYCSVVYSNILSPINYTVIDFNDLNFHPDSAILDFPDIYHSARIPDTLTWSTHLTQGETYTYKIKTIDSNDYIQAEYYQPAIYIDYNQNSVFNNQYELYKTYWESQYKYEDFNLTVPLSALPGKTTMRVTQTDVSHWPLFTGACDPNTLFIDFTLYIDQSPLCQDLALTETIINPSCFKDAGTVEVMVTGGTLPYHYQWNTELETDTFALLSPVYTTDKPRVIVTDAIGCKIRSNILQTNHPSPLIIDTLHFDSLKSVTIAGSKPTYSIFVNNNSTHSLIENEETIDLTSILEASGTYQVMIIDQNNCSDTITYTVPYTTYTSLPFLVYPNPTVDQITIEGINMGSPYKLYNIEGKLLAEGILDESKTISLTRYQRALYFLKFHSDEHDYISKIIKQ